MKTNHNQLGYTLAYFGSFVLLGMAASALGPSLPWLAERTGSEIGTIGFLFTATSLGYMLGSLGGGRGYDRLPGHRLLPLAILITGAGLAAVPYIGSLAALTPLMFFLGLSQGVLDVGGNLLLVWVHRARSAPFLNGLHFSFGLGAMLIPFIVTQALERSGSIAPAFWFMTIYSAFPALMLFRLASPARPGKSTPPNPARDELQFAEAIDGEYSAEARPAVSWRLVALISLVFFLYVGAEGGFGAWIFTYTTRVGLGSVTSAGLLTSAFWGGLMFGRLAIIPFSNRLRPETVIVVDFIACAAALLLILLLPASQIALWIGALTFGFFNGPIFPTLLAFAERRMTMSGDASRWFFVGTGAGGMSIPWLLGQLFASAGAQSVMWAILIAIVLGLAVFLATLGLRSTAASGPATEQV